jgi:hypothetical protein
MVVGRAARVVAPAVIAMALLTAMATSAQAGTAISPPTITAPLGGLGPYPVGTPVTFTFSEQGVGTAVAYKYTVNGVTKKVPAPSGVASVQIVPARQTSFLTAYAVAADGTVSGGTEDIFKAFTTHPATDKDFNGDGVPDLLTVGGTPGLAAGLWLATGQAKHPGAAKRGRLNVPATDIGINGNGLSIPGSPSDFNGAQAIAGQFTGDGFQDVLIYYPSGNDAGGGAVLAGSGDGSPLQSQISGNEFTITPGALTDANGDNPLQIVNAYGSIYGTGLPDLLAISGDPANGYYLDYYEASVPGGYFNTFAVKTATPDGTTDWNKWTLATLNYAGSTGMFLWNESTGALYLWAGLTATDNGNGTGTLAYTQYQISANWNKGKPLSTLEAADFGGDGEPGLWAVTPSGVATAYRISDLSTTSTATVRAGKPQMLSCP